MAKKVMIGIAAAAAVFIGVFVTTGWPPDFSGTEGAIGAAKRHQAQQMTPEDVKLGDTKTQEFLQSDVVARLMADAGARKALASDAVLQAFANQAFLQALGSDAVRQALGSQAFLQALASDAFREALTSEAVLQALNSRAAYLQARPGATSE